MSKDEDAQKTAILGSANFRETPDYLAVLEELKSAHVILHGAANLVTVLSTDPDENLTALAIANDVAMVLQNRIEHATESLHKARTLNDLKDITPNLKYYVEDALKSIHALANYYASAASKEDNINKLFLENPALATKKLLDVLGIGTASNEIGPIHISETAEYRKTRHTIDGIGDIIRLSSEVYESGISDMTSRNYNFAVADLNQLMMSAEQDIAAANSFSQLEGIRNRIDSRRSAIMQTYTPATTTPAAVLPEVAHGNFNNVEITAITTGVMTGLGLLLILLNRNRIKTIYNSCSNLAQSGLSFFKKTLSVIRATEDNAVVREARQSLSNS
jgi:hypothetical protein